MSSPTISRRVFLKASGGVLAGTLAFASGPIALLAPSRSWAMPLDNLGSRQGEVLLAVTRQIFPHPDLEDAVYAHVVKSLDRKAVEGALLTTLNDGIAELDKSAGGDWLALDDAARLDHLAPLAGTPFFEAIRGDAVVSLYDNPLAFAHFGYEGAEGDGGYLTKGFNDLTWLPDPPQPEGGYLPFEEPTA
ncbi:twin-arginine translocation signal domain-containing protein [Halomonas rhizosphaerae]|uniref:Twin-arginine translocation signal domain-containing protein n=1 Tax=Halomonas rhizosphaerae TaxID=3043296 RepID=A0ABT6UWI2_9GAMM|nr:twin-arginine translocation signal domain-containing protein [Halomonas rhizosphaerae]MDI5889623.1 twin-arginine translocation signal domain-containing protein [Halomonas rhizosphaerae]